MSERVRVNTLNGGYCEVVKHSTTREDKEIITFKVKYGLIVHAEFLRHRMLSRGVKSNRAIPAKTLRKEVLQKPYIPIHFGKNQAGMVANKEVAFPKLARKLWLWARYPMVFTHWLGDKLLKGHKEWLNRLLNPYQWVTETITATELDNLFKLRIHKDAQRDIYVIVKAMYEAKELSVPTELQDSEWHLPYVGSLFENGELTYHDFDHTPLLLEEAIKCSVARCARSSYDKHDGNNTTYKDDVVLYNMLVDSDPKHCSPLEHQATPFSKSQFYIQDNLSLSSLKRGITHIDKDGFVWSGNLKAWKQYRQLLKNHTCTDYYLG